MKFGEVPLNAAEGVILAHSVRLSGGAMKKGRRLSREDVQRLEAAGIECVVAASLEAGDVGEDEAAEFVATRLCGAGIRAASAFTGRANLFAEANGLLVVDADTIDAINAVDESITVATLSRYARVTPRQMLATVKIIPFAVARAHLDAVGEILVARPPVMRVAGFNPRRVALIQTRLPGMREAVLDKTADVTAKRIEALSGKMICERRCEHDLSAVRNAITETLDLGADIVLVAGASAIVDRRDVVPAAIVAAGGNILHFGMPMDPGNLILLARKAEAAIIGLPGCARSPKYNGIDEVLRRLAAGIEVRPETIMSLGVGGLLKETPDRPLPRAGSADADPDAARAPRVAALVLAAGQSRRMGGVNKLLLEVDGVPLVRRVVSSAGASACEWVVVVTGHQAGQVENALADLPVDVVRSRDFSQGLSASLASGIDALPKDCDAALVCLGDMPDITAAHLNAIIAAFDPMEERAVCVPTYQGKRGNPVLWDRRFFQELGAIRGDVGARHLIGEHAEFVCEVPMPDAAVLTDVDSPEAVDQLRERRDVKVRADPAS